MLKKSNFSILALLILAMTSCTNCTLHEEIAIPCAWQTPIKGSMTSEDPSGFLWWDALNDEVLTAFIMEASCRNYDVLLAGYQSHETLLKAVNQVSAEVAKNYIELQGLQARSKILEETIATQNSLLGLNKGLSDRGFFGSVKENEDLRGLDVLFEQRAQIEFSIEKTIFHLSTLLGYPPGSLNLCESEELPELTGEFPVGSPMDLICHNPDVRQARKAFLKGRNEPALYNYEKTMLNALERAESALAAFNYKRDQLHYLENAHRLTDESHQLIKDLYQKGIKDERDMLLAHQEFLSQKNALIQGKVDLLISYVDLYEVLGEAWEACCKLK